MEPEDEGANALDVAVAAAMARQYADDARTFLGRFAQFLESALGENAVTIQRAGFFGGDNRPVKRVEFTLPELGGTKATRYALEEDGKHGVLAQRIQVVRNIALKTETLSVEEWIGLVVVAIGTEAERNKSARDALNRFL